MNAQMNEAFLSSRTLEESDTTSRSSKHISGFMRKVRAVVAAALLSAVPASALVAEDAVAESPQVQRRGSLVIAGGGDLPEEVTDRFLELAGGEKAHIVVIPTASAKADQPDATVDSFWYAKRKGIFRILHTRDRDVADTEEFVQPLKEATGVWISGGKQERLCDIYLGTRTEREIKNVYRRGGAVAGNSAGAAIAGYRTIIGGNTIPKMSEGFKFFTERKIIFDQHFMNRERDERLGAALDAHQDCDGIGIDEGTAFVTKDGKEYVIGVGKVWHYTICPEKKERIVRSFKGGEEFIWPVSPMNVAATPMEE